jgi:hypothetical protein
MAERHDMYFRADAELASRIDLWITRTSYPDMPRSQAIRTLLGRALDEADRKRK